MERENKKYIMELKNGFTGHFIKKTCNYQKD